MTEKFSGLRIFLLKARLQFWEIRECGSNMITLALDLFPFSFCFFPLSTIQKLFSFVCKSLHGHELQRWANADPCHTNAG